MCNNINIILHNYKSNRILNIQSSLKYVLVSHYNYVVLLRNSSVKHVFVIYRYALFENVDTSVILILLVLYSSALISFAIMMASLFDTCTYPPSI